MTSGLWISIDPALVCDWGGCFLTMLMVLKLWELPLVIKGVCICIVLYCMEWDIAMTKGVSSGLDSPKEKGKLRVGLLKN